MMPSMASTLFGFEETLQFEIVVKTVVEGDIVETSNVKPRLFFEGVLQPMHPKELLVKSEGERKWKWWTLFTDMVLEVDTVIKDKGNIEYRVMASSDWQQAGYTQYQLVEGPGLL